MPLTLSDVIAAGFKVGATRVYLHPLDINEVAPLHWFAAPLREYRPPSPHSDALLLYEHQGGLDWYADPTVPRAGRLYSRETLSCQNLDTYVR